MRDNIFFYLYLGLKAGFKHNVKSQCFRHAFLKILYYLKFNMEYRTCKINGKDLKE